MRITCGVCGGEFVVPQADRDFTVHCPHCNRTVLVPGAATIAAEISVLPAQTPAQPLDQLADLTQRNPVQRRMPQRASSGLGGMVVLLGALALLVGGGIAAVLVATRPAPPEPTAPTAAVKPASTTPATPAPPVRHAKASPATRPVGELFSSTPPRKAPPPATQESPAPADDIPVPFYAHPLPPEKQL